MRYFLSRYAREMGQADPGATDGAMAMLTAASWPGNVRELGNTLKKALIFSRGGPLSPDEVTKALGVPLRSTASPDGDGGESMADCIRRELASGREGLFEELMDRFGHLVIRQALEATGGNRSQAARLLGLSRPTLIAKIEKYGLRIEAQARIEG